MTRSDEATATVRLADKLADTSFHALDPETVEIARQRVFDTLGALLLGEGVVAARPLREIPEELAGDQTGGPLDDIRRLSAAARASEVDDITTVTCTTAGCVAVPVALLLSNARRADDRTMLGAVVAGYEVMARAGAAIDGARQVYEGVWPSLVGAPMAAAATAGHILGLDAAATVNALAIAAQRTTSTTGRIAGDLTSRWLVFGCAAADGALAAMAAARGMVGDPGLVERALGRTGGAVDPDALMAGRSHWWIRDVDVKPFCTARQVQSAVEASQQASAVLSANNLHSVTVQVPRQYVKMIDRPEPHDRLASIASVQYQVAAALTHQESLYDVVRENLHVSPQTRWLMKRVKVCEAPDLTALYPHRWGGRVNVRWMCGQEAQREVHEPLGSVPRPLGWDGLSHKHRALGNGDPRLTRMIQACQNLGRDAGSQHNTILAGSVSSGGRSVT